MRPRRPLHVMLWPVTRLLLLTGAAACTSPGGDGPADAAGANTAPVPARDLAALAGPASWEGTLPCADCTGVATTLTLAPDGTYRRQGAYLGTSGGGDTVLADLGRWRYERAASRVLLQGSTEAPDQFAVEPDGTLRQLDLEGRDIASSLNYSLRAVPEPVLLTHPARIVVAFTYMADAAMAVECGSGVPYPVAMSDGYPSLERAYREAGITGGAPWIVRLKAHLDERPAMEGDGTTRSLVVDSLLGHDPSDGCATLRLQETVAAGPWRLVALREADSALTLPADNRASFAWDRAEGRFAGNSGCNRYSASGTLRGSLLAAGPAISTKMACLAPEANAVERRFLTLLSAQPSLRLAADTLVFSEGPLEVARFVRE